MKNFSLSILRVGCVVAILYIPIANMTGELRNISSLQAQQNQSQYTSMDTLIRVLHYTIPHKPFEFIAKSDGSGLQMPFCQECTKVLKDANLYNEPGVWIDQARLDELLRKEQELAEWMKPEPMCD